jgi:hypothetical protein
MSEGEMKGKWGEINLLSIYPQPKGPSCQSRHSLATTVHKERSGTFPWIWAHSTPQIKSHLHIYNTPFDSTPLESRLKLNELIENKIMPKPDWHYSWHCGLGRLCSLFASFRRQAFFVWIFEWKKKGYYTRSKHLNKLSDRHENLHGKISLWISDGSNFQRLHILAF